MTDMRNNGVVSRLSIGLVIALGVLAFSSQASGASTPRAGNQCKRREAGMKVGLLVCTTQPGGKYVWLRLLRTAGHGSSPEGSRSCDPNYVPCVPIAEDVDCAGGSGNGPAYVEGPVRVVGTDIYGLDRDGDGIGCEAGSKAAAVRTTTAPTTAVRTDPVLDIGS